MNCSVITRLLTCWCLMSALAFVSRAGGATSELAGTYWSGSYVRGSSTLGLNARFSLDDKGELVVSTEVPEWIWYEWSAPQPVDTTTDGVLRFRARYGEARLVWDQDVAEMIGTVGSLVPPVTLHLKQMPPPPKELLQERDVVFADGQCSGTLVTPPGDGPHPAVLMLHGRGCSTRLQMLRIGRALARYGVAAFAFDQRGAGASIGDCAKSTHTGLVDDAVDAMRVIGKLDHIDSTRVGVLATSAGAWTAQGIAKRQAGTAESPLAFIVTWVGPATSVAAQQRDSAIAIARQVNLSESDTSIAIRWAELATDQTAVGPDVVAELRSIERQARDGGWFNSMFGADDFPGADDRLESMWVRRHPFDPTDSLRALGATPYLAVFGVDDPVVPYAANAERLRTLLTEAGNSAFHIVGLPGVEHGLEHGDLVRQLDDGTHYVSFDRVHPGFFDETVRFLRKLEIIQR